MGLEHAVGGVEVLPDSHPLRLDPAPHGGHEHPTGTAHQPVAPRQLTDDAAAVIRVDGEILDRVTADDEI